MSQDVETDSDQGEGHAAQRAKDDVRRAAAEWALTNEAMIQSWNSRKFNKGEAAHQLSRPALIKIFKASNLRGGSFVQKKINYVKEASINFNKQTEELTILLTVCEGEPFNA